MPSYSFDYNSEHIVIRFGNSGRRRCGQGGGSGCVGISAQIFWCWKHAYAFPGIWWSGTSSATDRRRNGWFKNCNAMMATVVWKLGIRLNNKHIILAPTFPSPTHQLVSPEHTRPCRYGTISEVDRTALTNARPDVQCDMYFVIGRPTRNCVAR